MKIKYKFKDLEKAAKSNDMYDWNIRFFNKYPRDWFVWLLANFTNVHPLYVSLTGFLFILMATGFFLNGQLFLGALCYYIRYLTDMVDGKLARLKGQTSKLGAFMENYFGIVGVTFCFLALAANGFSKTNYTNVLWFGISYVYLFLNNIHTWSSMKVALLMGKLARNNKKQPKKILGLKGFLMRYNLQEPFGISDCNFLVLTVFPIVSIFIGHLLLMWTIMVFILFIKEGVWIYYYTNIIKKGDEE